MLRPGILLLLLGVCAGSASAETYRIGPNDNWFERLSGDKLQPGDEVILRGGTYSDTRRLVISHRGSAEEAVVIRGEDGERVVFRRPDARQNTLNLEGAQHLLLRNLEITGGAAGIRIRPVGDEVVRGIVLEQLHLHHLGGVAVTCNHPGAVYEQMTFRRNHIHHTSGHGEAFYLGGNNGTAIFRDSIVEENYLHDLQGPQVRQGDGIEVKQGSHGNRISGNVIHDTNYPGVIVYGTTGMPRNIIENNVIWNTGDHGIQAAADAVIRNNWIAGAGGAGIYSRDHQQAVTGNLEIQGNYVIDCQVAAIRIQRPQDGTGADDYSGPVGIVGNVFIASKGKPAVRIEPSALVRFSGNTGAGSVQGIAQTLEQWRVERQHEPKLPRLDENPAWQHLDRAKTETKFDISAWDGH